MELGDLKKKWAALSSKETPVLNKEDLQRKLEIVSASKRRIRTVMRIELIIGIVIYAGFFSVMISVGASAISSYMYKLVIVLSVTSIPIYYRLQTSFQQLSSIDKAQDLISNLKNFLIHYRRTLQFYHRGSQLISILILIIFLTDKSFLALPFWIQAAIVVYVLFFIVATGPYIKWVYGRKLSSIEELLKTSTET